MRRMMKAVNTVNEMRVRAATLMRDKKGENYVDTAVKILIAVVLGALLLAGLYALFGDVVMPTLTQRVQEMFNYAGQDVSQARKAVTGSDNSRKEKENIDARRNEYQLEGRRFTDGCNDHGDIPRKRGTGSRKC